MASKTIVVGYDGTDGSKAALAEAITVAQEIGGDILAVFAYDRVIVGGESHDLDAQVHARGDAMLAEAEATASAAGVTPKVDSIHADRGSATNPAWSAGAFRPSSRTRADNAARNPASVGSGTGVTRRRVSPITCSGRTSVPNSSPATLETSFRWSSSPPSVLRVAEVPTHWSRVAAVASRTRRISMATSAPCRPR